MADATNFVYNPDGNESGAEGAPSPAAQSTAIEPVSWTATEYIDHQQGPVWFVGLAVATAAIGAGVYFLAHDLAGAIIVALLGTTVGIFASRKPRQLAYELSDGGIKIGAKNYGFGGFKSFSIIQDGGMVSLDLNPVKRFMPPISVYFGPNEHEKIMAILEDRLPFEERNLDPIEQLTRRLHF